MLDAVVALEIDGTPAPWNEKSGSLQILITGGMDTTVSSISMALLYLSQHPDTLELLANDLSLMPAAVEEFLRLFSPVFLPGQVITRDVEIAVSISSRGQGDARWGPRPRILRSSTIL